MAKLLRSLLRRTVLGGRGNLVSLDDPFAVMPRLLAGHEVRGFVDAGSSFGRITGRLLERFPQAQAHLFEANPAFDETMKEMAAADARIHPNLVALSDREQTLTLHVTEHPGQTSLFRPGERMALDPRATPVAKEVQVPAVTLDGWHDRAGRPPVELLKMDIQAGELAAVRGGRRLLAESIVLVYTEVFF
jgi:FkbM family methyltransferase